MKTLLYNKKFQLVASIILFLTIWWIISIRANSMLFPSPYGTLKSFIDIIKTQNTWTHIGITFYRVLIGSVLGAVIGTALALLAYYFSFLKTFIQSVFYPFVQSVPNICWALVFVLWFGLSNMTPILIVTTATAPHFMINIWEGLKELDTSLIEMASTYTSNKFRVLMKVTFPMLYSYIFAAAKSTVMLAWKIVALGEVHGSVNGIGYMIHLANENYRIERMFGWTMIIVIILVLTDKVLFNFIDVRFIRRSRFDKINDSK